MRIFSKKTQDEEVHEKTTSIPVIILAIVVGSLVIGIITVLVVTDCQKKKIVDDNKIENLQVVNEQLEDLVKDLSSENKNLKEKIAEKQKIYSPNPNYRDRYDRDKTTITTTTPVQIPTQQPKKGDLKELIEFIKALQEIS